MPNGQLLSDIPKASWFERLQLLFAREESMTEVQRDIRSNRSIYTVMKYKKLNNRIYVTGVFEL